MQSEAASLREQLAAVVAESRERAEIAGVLQTEAASLREQLAAVMAGSTRQAELIETLRVECDAFRADAAESRLRAAAIAELQAECESLRPEVAGLEEKVAARTREMVRIDQESARLRADLEIARERLKHEVAARAELEQRTESLLGQATVFARARGEIADRDLYIAKVRARLDEIERSLTWRAGRPFRALARTAKRVLGR
jgi:chromosome segregation ATPase